MRFFYGVATTLAALGIAGFGFIQSGAYNVAASESHFALVNRVMHQAMHNSVETRTDEITVPANLADADMIKKGARAYDALCSACHLKPGQSESLIRKGLNPTPPRLTKAGHWGPAGQFWIIKHGIKMTGMPAWGGSHSDQELWELTAFLQQLPELSTEQYAALVNPPAAGEIMHDDGHAHDHGNMQSMSEPPETHPTAEVVAEDDHYADGHTH
ncbi:MAG: cytochrome c [Marinobacter sp.]|uniref:c-type cytochrome n=1 Tax=Marinobacter sp. TaxID=50741 RepID=UPI00299DF701|nr:cytochrome c [Marinobacter sp.]MDX1755532.1 cytochrome c [Marinobacter sp.]